MYLLYSLLLVMLLSSLCLLAIPFIRTNTISSPYFLGSAIFVIVFSSGFYFYNQNHTALKQWLTVGQQHYQLQVAVKQLGGFKGMIDRIKKKLAANPQDAEGWFILGKLYLANGDYKEAKEAFNKAAQWRPGDPEINRFYNIAALNTT